MEKYLFAAGLLLASLTSSQALLLSFDGSPITAGTGAPLSSTFTIDFAELITDDANGPLANPFWAIDGTAPAVTPGSPAAAGFGLSNNPALDAVSQEVMFTFASPISLAGFSTMLDDGTQGNLTTVQIKFYDAANVLLNAINLSQSTPNFVAASNAALNGVKKIVFPSSALYDNVQINPVPEPGLTILGTLGGLGLAMRRRRTALQAQGWRT